MTVCRYSYGAKLRPGMAPPSKFEAVVALTVLQFLRAHFQRFTDLSLIFSVLALTMETVTVSETLGCCSKLKRFIDQKSLAIYTPATKNGSCEMKA